MKQQQQEDRALLPTTSPASADNAAAAGAGASSYSSGQLRTAGLVAAWYASNIGVLLLNKYLLSVYGFRYPVFLTACHMSACALLSSLLSAATTTTKPSSPPRRPLSRGQAARVAVLGAVFCGSVVGGNVSLRYLPVSFNQAVGATTPFFTALIAYAIAARREAGATYAALVPVVVGVVIATGGEAQLHGPAPVHGASGRRPSSPRDADHGARRARRGGRARQGGPQLRLAAALQLLPGLPGEPDQLPGHQAHQPAHDPGPREREGRGRRRGFHPHLQEPGDRHGHAGIRGHHRRRDSVRRGKEEEQVSSAWETSLL